MIHERRLSTFAVGGLAVYLELFEQRILPIVTEYGWDLIGFWSAGQNEVGTLNQAMHLWRWEDLAVRERRRDAVYADPVWRAEVVPVITTVLTRQENAFLRPAPFSPIR
jgi:hypothetical protein